MSTKTFKLSYSLTTTEKTATGDSKTVTVTSDNNENVYSVMSKLLSLIHVVENNKDKKEVKNFYDMLQEAIKLGNAQATNSGDLPLARVLNFASRAVQIAYAHL